jgi:hypothetical protein
VSTDDFEIPGLVEPVPDEPGGPFEGRDPDDVVRLVLADGTRREGSYMHQAGMHFLHERDGSMGGHVSGPYTAADVVSVTVLRTREEVRADRMERKLGDPVPGTVRRTRDGYEARLELLARMVASTGDRRRRDQIECQFDRLADEIQLAKTKRAWMIAVARWARHSNETPTKIDLSGGDATSAERFQRPRPQDFDPDVKVRRARVPIPPHVLADPRSTVNMVKALRAAGFNARASIYGEVTHDAADLLVDFPGGKEKGRFSLTGSREPDGSMRWSAMWDGNGSRADQTRRQRAMRRPDFATFRAIMGLGTGHAPAPMPGVPDADAPASPGMR